MNTSRTSVESHAVLGIRLLAFGGLLICGWWLCGNLLLTAGDFTNWAHPGHYFATQLARPLLGIAFAFLTFWRSRKWGQRLARELD